MLELLYFIRLGARLLFGLWVRPAEKRIRVFLYVVWLLIQQYLFSIYLVTSRVPHSRYLCIVAFVLLTCLIDDPKKQWSVIGCSAADIFSWINLVRTRSETSITELSRIDSEAAGYGAALYLVWMFGMYLCGESYMARVIKTVMILLGLCWVSLLLAVNFWENTFEHILFLTTIDRHTCST